MATIKLCTVANKSHPGLTALGLSTVKYGYDFTVIGYRRPYEGLNTKLIRMVEWWHDKPNTLIMFVDAFDCIMCRDASIAYRRYNQHFNGGLVFGAETNAWPTSALGKYHPTTKNPYRYLNSGCYIGESKDIVDMLTSIYPLDPAGNDQEYLMRKYVVNPNRCMLDTNAYLFFNMCNAVDDIVFDGNSITNWRTRTKPCVIHGNGGVDMTNVLTWSGIKEALDG